MDVDHFLEKSALLIGPTYNHLETAELQLQGTLNDVALIKDVISEPPFSFTSITELTHTRATHSNILESLSDIAHNAPADSVVLIYFSGHGCVVKGQEQGHYDEGLVPVDATHENIERMCITGDAFADPLRKLMEKNVATTVIFDCCYSGHMYRGEASIKEPGFKITAVKQINFTGKAVPVEHDDDSPIHDPAQQTWNLPYPVQETWTKKWETEGWRPTDKDKFIFLAACNSYEKAFEGKEELTQKCYGIFTHCLASILRDVAQQNMEISYEVLFSLLRQRFLQKGAVQSPQTPQIEGGEFGTVLFDIKKVKLRRGFVEVVKVLQDKKEVVLGAGVLQLLVDGVYKVFDACVTADHLDGDSGQTCNQHLLGSIEVRPSSIGMTTSKGDIIEHIGDMKPGSVAKLSKRGSMRRETVVLGPHVTADTMRLKIEETKMFHVSEEKESDDDCILTITKMDNGKEAWCAHRRGRLILPLVYPGQEDVMAENLVKDARYRMISNLNLSNSRELQKVVVKVVKIKKINKHQLSTPNLKQQNMAIVLRTHEDLYQDAVLRNDRPTFVAHKTYERQIGKLGLVESTGDALVVQIVNHESFSIHICLLFLQLDGGIVAQYPKKKGSTIELKSKESFEELIRMYIPTDSLRRYCEPDVKKPEPDRAVDCLMLLATTEPCDFGPLLQTEVAFGGPMNEHRNTEAHHSDLNPLEQFQKALCYRDGEVLDGSTDRKWLILKREFWLIKSNYD